MKKLLALLCVAALLLAITCGCAGNDTNPEESAQGSPEASAAATQETTPVSASESAAPASDAPEASAESSPAETAAESPLSGLTYPLCEKDAETVTLYVSLPPHVAPYMENVSDSAAYRAAAEATGVNFETTTVSTAVMSEQVQLLFASGTYTDYDLMENVAMSYGNIDKALADGIVIELNDYLATDMPDFYNFLQSDEEVRKTITTNSGAIADIVGRGTGGRPQGFGIRKDWLDQLGIDVPTTYDELYDVLTAFKSEFNCPEPLLMFSEGFLDNNFLSSGLDAIQEGYYVEDGQVKFTYQQEGYKEYCQMLKNWYDEGLFSRDFTNNTQGAGISYDSKMLDGTLGVFMTGSDIFSSASKAGSADLNWEVVPIADMTRTGAETIPYGKSPNSDPLTNKWNVTSGVSAEHMPIVLGFANWFFTEAGSLACNFGIEGEGFEYVNGEPMLTELVTNNPDGLGSFIAEAKYTNWNAPYCLDERIYDSLYDTETQREAQGIWNANRSTDKKCYGNMTSEESEEYSVIWSDIETYLTEMTVKFITGAEDIDQGWEGFQAQLENMNLAECISYKQAAYDRYMSN